MLFSGPLVVFLLSALLTPVFNYWVVSTPEGVYEEQVSSLKLETKSPFYAVNMNEHPYYLTGVAKKTQKLAENKPGLNVALLDGKFVELKEDDSQ